MWAFSPFSFWPSAEGGKGEGKQKRGASWINLSLPTLSSKLATPLLLSALFWPDTPCIFCALFGSFSIALLFVCKYMSFFVAKYYFLLTPNQLFLNFGVSQTKALWHCSAQSVEENFISYFVAQKKLKNPSCFVKNSTRHSTTLNSFQKQYRQRCHSKTSLVRVAAVKNPSLLYSSKVVTKLLPNPRTPTPTTTTFFKRTNPTRPNCPKILP